MSEKYTQDKTRKQSGTPTFPKPTVQGGEPSARRASPQGRPSVSRVVGNDRFHKVVNPSQVGSDYTELIPIDLGEGTFNAADLAARHDKREAVHNAAIVARHDFARDLSQQTADSRSNHETSRGRAGKPTRDSGIVQTALDDIHARRVINYEPSSGPNVTQASPGKPWSSVPAKQFAPRTGATSKANKK
jgi:hypothetical protein